MGEDLGDANGLEETGLSAGVRSCDEVDGAIPSDYQVGRHRHFRQNQEQRVEQVADLELGVWAD